MGPNHNKLTLIICTRNRAFILPECLESLRDQKIGADLFEVLVIDNGSGDETREIIAQYPSIRYVFEPRIGLSVARNTGFRATTTEWVGYIDDDAKAHPNLVKRALGVIDQFNFDAFGGMYYPWFRYGHPKWLPEKFGEKEKLRDTVGEIQVPKLSGGIFFIKRAVLESVNGFTENFGMSGSVGYCEENELQMRLLRKGYSLGFDPELIIDHCVLPHKLSVFWHLKSEYAKVRDSERLGIQQRFSVYLLGLFRSLLALSYKIPKGIYHLLILKEYYWQNLILDLFIPIMRGAGRISSILRSKTN